MSFLEKELIGSQKMRMNRESLSLPKEFSQIIADCPTPECFITVAPQRLMLFPLGSWQLYKEKLLATGEARARKLLHMQMKYGSKLAEPDSSGRIKLPHILFEYLKSPEEVYVSGMVDHLEIFRVDELAAELSEFMDHDPIYPEDFIL